MSYGPVREVACNSPLPAHDNSALISTWRANRSAPPAVPRSDQRVGWAPIRARRWRRHKAYLYQALTGITGGDGGIRTLDRPLQAYNGLANRRLQPLGHVSGSADMPDARASRKRQIQRTPDCAPASAARRL